MYSCVPLYAERVGVRKLMKSLSWLSFAGALLAGCMAGAKLTPIDARHPASPDAPEAKMPEPAAMLREQFAPLPDAKPSSAQHQHGMHGSSEAAKPTASANDDEHQRHEGRR